MEEDEDLVKKGKPKKNKDVGPDDIKGHYIVKLKDNADPDAAIKHVDAKPTHKYTKVIKGFSGPLGPGQLKKLKERDDVESIEEDQLVTTLTTQTMDGAGQPWGLDRIDQYDRPLNSSYIYFRSAWGVRAYVIDTGIQSNHPDFYSALAMYDVFGGNGQDCNGHGTHVAGTIGGNVHGVAKQTFLRGVRVLGCNGSGSWSGVIAGIDWVAKYHIKPAVANLSLGGGYSATVNAAVNNLANSGVFVVVAAGNSYGADACAVSPAGASNVFTVAAIDRNDARAAFSNIGTCVALYAPGVDIKSTWIGSTSKNLSGTSMAAPHVTGTAALYKAIYGDLWWSDIEASMIAWAARDRVSNNPSGTANRVLYQPF
jgi:subtilisin family serine protease